MPTHAHLINGAHAGDHAGATLTLTNPATGEVVADILAGGARDADAAVEAARKAAAGWQRTGVGERTAALHALARAVESQRDELAALQTRENGKPLGMSRGDVDTAAATLRQYAELGPLHRGRALVGDWDAIDTMVHEPYGVAAVIIPWNDPLGILSGLLGACLVTGNTVVVKPSERASLAVLRLVELLDVPPGVCNVLLGDARAGRALVGHPGVDLVVHVGALETGRWIAETCGARLCKAVLELGGNDPLVVDADVDPAWAAAQAAAGAFANAGQICMAVERIYVHRALAEAFTAALVAEAQALRAGDPLDPATDLGPLVDERLRRAVHDHVREAVAGGARLLCGGEIPEGPGCYYPPTVLDRVAADRAVMREETFGPVAPIQVVDSFAAGLEAASAGRYGLSACVLTGSQEHAQRAWRELPAGTVKVNAVWGGAPGGAAEPHRASGLGFGYGPELLDEVTTTKVVHARPCPPRPPVP
jgi:acyl-CoA reductase-like NAD-dependent aldehyde dehydrogenase